jgi:DNA-binding NtrC family response regulator
MKEKILVVEDDLDLQKMYTEILESDEYQIETASNGEEGVMKFKEVNPTLIIMDSDMPILNGYDASLKIKQIDKNAKIILITGYSKVAEGMQEKGGDEFVEIITKPIGMDFLLETVKKYCV